VGAKLLHAFPITRVLRRVVGPRELPPQEAAARGPLVASQLVGLVTGRYVLRRYLTGDVDLPA
jgi:hypothetical protein